MSTESAFLNSWNLCLFVDSTPCSYRAAPFWSATSSYYLIGCRVCDLAFGAFVLGARRDFIITASFVQVRAPYWWSAFLRDWTACADAPESLSFGTASPNFESISTNRLHSHYYQATIYWSFDPCLAICGTVLHFLRVCPTGSTCQFWWRWLFLSWCNQILSFRARGLCLVCWNLPEILYYFKSASPSPYSLLSI